MYPRHNLNLCSKRTDIAEAAAVDANLLSKYSLSY
jgi:hypothetical protein